MPHVPAIIYPDPVHLGYALVLHRVTYRRYGWPSAELEAACRMTSLAYAGWQKVFGRALPTL